jgi:hypothetical protein
VSIRFVSICFVNAPFYKFSRPSFNRIRKKTTTGSRFWDELIPDPQHYLPVLRKDDNALITKINIS